MPGGASAEARAAVQAMLLGLMAAVPLGIVGFLLAKPLLAIMGAPPGVLANSSFAAIVFGSNGVILMLFLINAVFRGAGDAGQARGGGRDDLAQGGGTDAGLASDALTAVEYAIGHRVQS